MASPRLFSCCPGGAGKKKSKKQRKGRCLKENSETRNEYLDNVANVKPSVFKKFGIRRRKATAVKAHSTVIGVLLQSTRGRGLEPKGGKLLPKSVPGGLPFCALTGIGTE